MSVEEFNKMPHFICEYIAKYAKERPEDIAIIDADDGKWVTWEIFNQTIDMYALELLEMGYQKGDIIITQMPLILEHTYLMHACYKLGIIICPLDVRLREREVVRCTQLLKEKARMFVAPDDTDSEDKLGRKKFYPFKQHARALREQCPFIKDYIQLSPIEDADKGTIGVLNWLKAIREKWLHFSKKSDLHKKALFKLNEAYSKVKEDDPILIIYTTGSTGFPKPSLLTNVGIVAQNYCMAKGFKITIKDRMLVNLPPSHVGCVTEQLATTIFAGAISVIIHGFKADKSLKAIQDYKVTIFGQIPSLFELEWRLKDYNSYDLSSLRFAIYGGQAVSRKFLEQLSTMAPQIGSGLGLTEMSGFCSYTLPDAKVEDILDNLGHDYPLSPLSIRKPMNPDGTAGEELPPNEVGEICYTGPQVFAGYFGNEKATRETISEEGVLYTGDMGFKDEKRNLHMAGRRKFIIKPKGFQVYPPEIEAFIEHLPEVALAGVIGAKHEVFSEGIVAFIELKHGKKLTVEKLRKHCEELAMYKRPSLYIFLDEIPLNRVDKTDYQYLYKIVDKYINQQREKGGWDSPRE